MLHANNYLPPKFDPGFKRTDNVMVYVNKSVKDDVVCNIADLCQKIINAIKRNNQCFIVVCMYISPTFKHYLNLKEVELLLKDIFTLLGSPPI